MQVDDDAGSIEPDLGIALSWRPSPQLRERLLIGVLAVLVTGALSATSMLLTLFQEKQPGFTIALGLGLAAIVPQFWELRAYLGLAEETQSDSLKRTALGVIVSGWLLTCLDLADETIFIDEAVVAMLVAALALFLGLIVYCFVPFFKVSGVGAFLAIWLSFRLFTRLPQLLPGMRLFDPMTRILIVAGVTAALLLVILYIWFGVTLIRLRHRLGGTAALAGWGNLLGLLGGLAVGGWFIAQLFAVAGQPGAIDQEFEEVMASHLPTLTAAGLGGLLLSAVLTVMLFLGACRRGDPWADDIS